MNTTLQALAAAYLRSAAGSRVAVRDYLLDYEKFLRDAGVADGDARELAEADLLAAQRASGGLVKIDRDARSGLPLRVRVARAGGEAWLFGCLGAAAPVDRRGSNAAFLVKAGQREVPADYRAGWQSWFSYLARRARAGESILPFKRGETAANQAYLDALAGILNWRGESLVRYASAVICGDSKRLQTLQPGLLAALKAITGEEKTLADFGILEKPRTVLLHGPLELCFADHTVDFSSLPGPITLSETNLLEAVALRTSARLCLTVENEDVFQELAKRNPGVLLVQTSYPGSAARRLLAMLPAELACHHFGDSDPAGFDILRDLREKSGRAIQPFLMKPNMKGDATPFSDTERTALQRLLDSPSMADLQGVLAGYLAGNAKGKFEQESIPIQRVLEALLRV